MLNAEPILAVSLLKHGHPTFVERDASVVAFGILELECFL